MFNTTSLRYCSHLDALTKVRNVAWDVNDSWINSAVASSKLFIVSRNELV